MSNASYTLPENKVLDIITNVLLFLFIIACWIILVPFILRSKR